MAVETIDHTITTTKTFPKSEVEAKLGEMLLDAVTSDAGLKGIMLPAEVPSILASPSVQLDSLVVVDLLCGLDAIVGMELKDSLVKAGGYRTANEAIEHLLPRIEKAWLKNGSGGKK